MYLTLFFLPWACVSHSTYKKPIVCIYNFYMNLIGSALGNCRVWVVTVSVWGEHFFLDDGDSFTSILYIWDHSNYAFRFTVTRFAAKELHKYLTVGLPSMMPRYGTDTAGTRHRHGSDMYSTCKKCSIGYDTTRYVAHFKVSVHHSLPSLWNLPDDICTSRFPPVCCAGMKKDSIGSCL